MDKHKTEMLKLIEERNRLAERVALLNCAISESRYLFSREDADDPEYQRVREQTQRLRDQGMLGAGR